jgi:hypothetical protein
MTAGLKIQKMMRDNRRDREDLIAEANMRKDVSDNILDAIYGKIIESHKKGEKKRPPGA